MRDDVLSRRLEEICQQLGYTESETFVTAATFETRVGSTYVVREAIQTIGISGVFGVSGSLEPSAARPIVYLATATEAQDIRRIRRDVWTQGVVPFLVIVSPGSLTICSGFEPPSEQAITIEDDGSLPEELTKLSAARLRQSAAWQNFDVALKSSVDNRLIDAIEALNDTARSLNLHIKNKRNLVNAAIGRFLYLYVLIDRGILPESWLRAVATDDGAALFARSVCRDAEQNAWTAHDAFIALDAVDREINGTVFPISAEDRVFLTDDVCRLIHAVLRAGTSVKSAGGQQLDFFDVSYGVLRTETISAIYERFIAIEDGTDKADDGVFYTPPHLADHVLDLMEQTKPLTKESRIIDPAAGSGVFLVGAFRRIMERSTPLGGWSPRHIHDAHALLQTCIFGIEKHPQAANVCRFSLYLTLLDYVGRAPIEMLAAAARNVKFLPALDANVRSMNAFQLATELPTSDLLTPRPHGYTHVIGNPPWSQKGGQKDRANNRRDPRQEGAVTIFAAALNKLEEPVGHGRLSDYFVWLAKKHLATHDGVIAFVLPTRSLVGLHSRRFAHAVARTMTPVFVGNLSHLRRKLFDGAQAAATIVVLKNRPPLRTDQVAVYRPLLTSLPLGRKRDVWALFLAQADMQYFQAEDLQSGESGWYEQTMLRTLDRRTRGALAIWTRAHARSFGDFLSRSKLSLVKGPSPSDSGVSRRPPGGKKDVGILAITREALENTKPKVRARFSGNVILVPRSMGPAFYLREPHAYSSSYNAILPQAQETGGVFDPWAEAPYAMADKAIAAMIAYLNAPILRYFAALFGSGHLANDARFEREELLLVPCPYVSLEDPAFRSLGEREDVDQAILEAMNAGAEFRRAYEDFRDFRVDFGNARIPGQSFASAGTDDVDDYLKRLDAEIASALPRGTLRHVKLIWGTDAAAPEAIQVLFDGTTHPHLLPTPNRFLSASIIEAPVEGGPAVVWKSASRHAWTIEQAVADAQVVIRELHRDGIEHRKPAACA